MTFGCDVCCDYCDWELEIGDWGFGLGIGYWDWGSELGMEIGGWGFELGIGIEQWDYR